jgi:hypothetical protein
MANCVSLRTSGPDGTCSDSYRLSTQLDHFQEVRVIRTEGNWKKMNQVLYLRELFSGTSPEANTTVQNESKHADASYQS